MNSLVLNRKKFCRKYKIKGAKNFINIRYNVKRYEFSYFSVVFLRNGFSHNRFGIVVSRKVAMMASKRNRMKRLLREMFRLYYSEICFLGGFFDIYVFIKKDFSCLKMNILFQEFNEFCLEKKLII